ncbi:MAG TPA: pro-sigmaK processing inhibitor BofA family protein [Candidatus Merdenecus merdavium]|nr:pro-sigmaK processing inhibitor BofA family protein [Candidatus Merdenecus merdavium]
MYELYGMVAIGVVCAIVLVIGIFRNKTEYLLNVILRLGTGLMSIYVMNQVFMLQNIQLSVGINPMSVSVIGFLGLPGVALLYGVLGCKFI